MEMEKEILQTCRICLTRGVRMHLASDTYLQEIYEQLTSVPFQREDGRPLLICYICKARLKNCHTMKLNCLQSEEYFTESLNNHIKPMPLQHVNTLRIVHPIIRLNCVPVVMKNPDDVHHHIGDDNLKPEPLEITDVKVKEEYIEDKEDNTIDKSNLYTAPVDKIKTEEFNTEYNDIVHTSEANDNIDTKTNELSLNVKIEPDCNAQDIQHKDLCPRTMKLVLNRISLDCVKTSGAVVEKAKLPVVKENYSITTSRSPEVNVRLAPNKNVKKKQPMKTTEYKNENIVENISAMAINIIDTSGELQTCVKTYKCDICKKNFKRKDKLKTHIRTHIDVNKYFNKNGNVEKPYKCDKCEKCFKIKTKLKIHSHTHTGEKPYRCDICDKYFTQKSALTRHSRRIHTDEKPYKCDICDKYFSERSNLVSHTRVHTGKKPHRCDICDKCFGRKNNLLSHIRIHTGVRPHRCDICSKYFSKRGTLSKHIHRKHTDEKPFKCDTCQKSYSLKSDLVTHSRITKHGCI